MSNDKGALTWDQAGFLLILFKNKEVTREKFEAMKPFITDLCEADLTKANRDNTRLGLGLEPIKRLVVNYNMPLQNLALEHHLTMDKRITPELFPTKRKGKAVHSHKPRLFHGIHVSVNGLGATEDMVKLMKKDGYRPANIREVMAYNTFSGQEPYAYDFVLALGSMVEIEGETMAPALHHRIAVDHGFGNLLSLMEVSGKWDPTGLQFLGVRE